jgi:hypothetical protein
MVFKGKDVMEMHIWARHVIALDLTTHIGPLSMPHINAFGHYDRVMGLINRAKSDESEHIKLMFGGESVEVQVDNFALPPPACNGPVGLYV